MNRIFRRREWSKTVFSLVGEVAVAVDHVVEEEVYDFLLARVFLDVQHVMWDYLTSESEVE